MPKVHPVTGLVACGTAGGRVSFGAKTGEQTVLCDGGCTFWFSEDEIAFLGPQSGSWQGTPGAVVPQLVNINTRKRTELDSRQASFMAAGRGRWQAATAGQGFSFGSCGEFPGGTVSRAMTDFRGAASATDGTIALVDAYQVANNGFRLGRPDGTITDKIADGTDPYNLTVIDADRAIWPAGNRWGVYGIATPPLWLRGSGRACWCEVNGVVYLVHWLDGVGLVARRADSPRGRIVSREDREYHYDAVPWQNGIRIAWVTMDGEPPGSLVVDFWDCSSDVVDLVSPVVPVDFGRFNHPVLIAPFKDPDNESGAAAEIVVNATGQSTSRQCFVAEDSFANVRGQVLGVYSERSTAPGPALELAAQRGTRLLLCHDAPDDWTPPPGLRPWDIPALELYRFRGEALETARNRWARQLQQLLTTWSGDVAVVPQFYCMGGAPPSDELWTVAEVLDGLRTLTDLVNLSSRIKVVAPFSWRRANGITGHQELRDAFASLLRATPGQPTLHAVGEGSDMPVRPVITIKSYAQQLRPNKATNLVDMVVGDTTITVRLDAGSNLFVEASNGAGSERTGLPNRHIDIGPGSGPVDPPQPVDVVTFYDDINYKGASRGYSANVALLEANDRVSSIRVPAGKFVIIYADRDFGGESLKLTSDVPDLRALPGPGKDRTWNDVVSSIKLTDDVVIDPPKPEPDTTSFRTVSGHLLSVENGVVVAKRTDGDGSEQFRVERFDDEVALKASNGKYVSAEGGGGRELTANRTAVGGWERFKPQRVAGGAVALQTSGGLFVSPQQGGGGIVLANGPSIGPWEPLKSSRSLFAGGQQRVGAGQVRSDGRAFVDNLGRFYPFGTSLFWGLWAAVADPAKLDRNLETAQRIGCDYTRDFGEVGGGSWEDRVINPNDADYRDRLAGYLDRKMERYNLKTALTIFGGGTGVNPDLAVDKVISAIRGREAAILYLEVTNERKFDTDTHRRLCRKLRDALPSMLVATSSPGDTPNGLNADVFDLPVANLIIVHTERQDGDESWRQVRQPVDVYDFSVPGDNNEPPGLQSSVAMLSDPLRLAMLRAVGLTSGLGAFVLHTGAGVRGGGAADLATGKFYLPRKANLDEYGDELETVARAIKGVDSIVPVDAVNWRKTKGHWSDTQLFADVVWSDDPARFDHGCVRVYGSYSSTGYVEHVIGIRRYVNLTQKAGRAHVRAINPLTLETVFEKDVQDGETFRLEGDPTGGSNSAYIVIGTR